MRVHGKELRHFRRLLAVTCSHTFAALNLIEGGPSVRGIHPEISTDGKTDQIKALQLCPAWKTPMVYGIPCIVFRREFEAACPELPGLLSMAGNQSHGLHSAETKVQLMLHLHQLFMAQTTPAASASWEQFLHQMAAMRPHYASVAKECAEFAAEWSGGDDAPSLNEAEAYVKGLRVRREPEDGQLRVLANAQLKRFPRWAIACLKTLLQAPDHFCKRKGEASMFCMADVKLMETKLLPKITEACGFMDKARKWIGTDVFARPGPLHKIMGDMDVRLVMHVHGFAKKV